MTDVQKGVPTSEVLERAADLIRDSRWTTGFGWPGTPDHDGQALCLEGGIMAALGIEYDDRRSDGGLVTGLYECPAYKAVQEYLKDRRRFHGNRLWTWNDSWAKGKTDVITVLRATARREKKKELASE